jgi:hypothetical protein
MAAPAPGAPTAAPIIAPVAPPASAPIPVPFSRVLNGCPEHPVTANSITIATATATDLEAMHRIFDSSSEIYLSRLGFIRLRLLLLLC